MTEASIGPFHQEQEAPVEDAINKLDKVFYLLKSVTHPSTVKTPDSDPSYPIQRSLITRNVRAGLLKKFRDTSEADRDARRKIIKEAHEWDDLTKQFLNQAEVKVTLPGLGEQTARVSIVKPPHEETVDAEMEQKPPVFIIPGISNDLDCIAYIAPALAKSGRTVISAGYPESFMGGVTDEFVQAAVKDNAFTVHADFFEAVMDKVVENNQPVELWGFSTGGPIVGQMLTKENVQKRVERAVLLSPAGCIDQSVRSINLGGAQEIPLLLKRRADTFPKLVWTAKEKVELANKLQLHLKNMYTKMFRRDNNEVVSELNKHEVIKERKQQRKAILGTLMKNIAHNYPQIWRNMRVQDEGDIIVVAGGKDNITKAYKAGETFQKNPQVRYAVLPEESHASSFLNPSVLEKIATLQSPQEEKSE